MSTATFTMDELMALLVAKVGLPAHEISENPGGTFADIGLDSLAFLQLQSEVKSRYGVELPTCSPLSFTFGDIVTTVNTGSAPAAESAA